MTNISKLFKGNMKRYGMLIALLAIVLFFYIVSDGILLAPRNVSNIIGQIAFTVILAVGMLNCILSGGNIDLSVGSLVAMVGACAGVFITNWGWNLYVSLAVCLVIGILVGMWQGFWIAYVRIPAFIVTLSGMLVFRGLSLLICGGATIPIHNDAFQLLFNEYLSAKATLTFMGATYDLLSIVVGVVVAAIFCVVLIASRVNKIRKGYDAESLVALIIKLVVISAVIVWFFSLLAQSKGIPTVLITLGIVIVFYTFITTKTVLGRHLYALGGNEKAAHLSGVKTKRILFLTYVNMGFLSALAGLVYAARLRSASTSAGLNFELNAIGACFIGGASAYGGIGTVFGTVIGALIIAVLNNGMSILGVNINVQSVIKGLVLLLAVAFDVITKMNIQVFKRRKPATAESKA